MHIHCSSLICLMTRSLFCFGLNGNEGKDPRCVFTGTHSSFSNQTDFSTFLISYLLLLFVVDF
jgi:hypothetical protein